MFHDIAVSTQHDHATRVPFSVYKSKQARLSRHRLYPLTVFYTIYSAIVSVLAARSAHPWVALLSYWAGLPAWSLVEYLFHRYVLHGCFPRGEGIIKRFLRKRLDPLPCEHPERPFDGAHISGGLKDLLLLFAVAAPASFIFSVFTTPALLAGSFKVMLQRSGFTTGCISTIFGFLSSGDSNASTVTISVHEESHWFVELPAGFGTSRMANRLGRLSPYRFPRRKQLSENRTYSHCIPHCQGRS